MLWRCGGPGEFVRIAQLQPGHVDDLLRVAPEVRNAVEDRRHSGHAEALDATGFCKLPGVNAGQHPLRFINDGFEAAHQLVLLHRTSFGELGGTIAIVGCPADAGHNPLSQIAAQVQDQVADAVEARLGA